MMAVVRCLDGANPGGHSNKQNFISKGIPGAEQLNQDRVEQIIAQARHNADNPHGNSSQKQTSRPNVADQRDVHLEQKQEHLTCTDGEDSSPAERARPDKMRSRKRRLKGSKTKAGTEKRQVQNQWSDYSSDEGMSALLP